MALPTAILLAGLMLGVSLAAAAPSEGTAGQTVTSRSLNGSAAVSRRAPAPVKPAPTSRPTWSELSPAQRQALAPLSLHWDRLSEERKHKWLAIARSYPSLTEEDQAKLHRRMERWTVLTKGERAQARQNFTTIRSLGTDRKLAEWEAYQALSLKEKRKLAAQAPVRPAGLATVKPARQPKLTQLPKRASPADARMAEAAPLGQMGILRTGQEFDNSEPERSPYEDEPADSQ